jgi:hypothetical protein
LHHSGELSKFRYRLSKVTCRDPYGDSAEAALGRVVTRHGGRLRQGEEEEKGKHGGEDRKMHEEEGRRKYFVQIAVEYRSAERR